jgi:hypothetical protein
MGGAIGDILPLAIGVAISPVPIIAVILMLFSKKAKGNSLAFLVGWVLGLAIVGVIVPPPSGWPWGCCSSSEPSGSGVNAPRRARSRRCRSGWRV